MDRRGRLRKAVGGLHQYKCKAGDQVTGLEQALTVDSETK
jgi:hypothetical protein